ncbi:hypothetical protein CMO92_04350 [Candidatus Woesearchaeota archaeon]|nr:hypothetical protein [Candidatus Woesearchaeota archaeon]|tara:strand:- start:10 stop:270 length:261 start_codon:yes stop_codon:yes gene_type:complete
MNSNYSFDLKTAIQTIKKNKAKQVLLQLPDGIKPYAKEIQDKLEKETNTQILIWGGTCFGSCDLPLEAKYLNIDLVLHFGHSQWLF